jgi:uncharacterized protein (DUF885 family)
VSDAQAWLDRFFESYYRLRPVNATFTGMHDHDDRLPDWSPNGLAAMAGEMRQLRASRPAVELSIRPSIAELDVTLADAYLEIQLAELEDRQFVRGNPSLWAGEAVFAIISLMTREFAPLERRMESAVRRMRGLPRFLADARATFGAAAVPAAWRDKALRECEGARRLFGVGTARWAASCDNRKLGRDVLSASVVALDAFEAFAAWLQQCAVGPEIIGCGPELFDLLLARGHWCATSKEDLAMDAVEQLTIASDRLQKMAHAVDPNGWPGVQARLAEQHPSTDEYLLAFEEMAEGCRELAVAKNLVTWPDAPIRFVPIPETTRDAAPYLYYLFYRSPAPLDRIETHDAVVTPIDAMMPPDTQERLLRGMNDSVIKLNHVVHHGSLGHHVQNAYAACSTSRIGQIAAVDCASRIAMFSGGTMAEGWACYATELMDEAGFLTELERVSEQHTQVRMLARAVVDISIHAGAISLDEATHFYVDHASMSVDAARGEAIKNSMFPGAAVMYWLGTQGIRDLRARSDRPLREFHDELLSFGSIPVSLIGRAMGLAS